MFEALGGKQPSQMELIIHSRAGYAQRHSISNSIANAITLSVCLLNKEASFNTFSNRKYPAEDDRASRAPESLTCYRAPAFTGDLSSTPQDSDISQNSFLNKTQLFPI